MRDTVECSKCDGLGCVDGQWGTENCISCDGTGRVCEHCGEPSDVCYGDCTDSYGEEG